MTNEKIRLILTICACVLGAYMFSQVDHVRDEIGRKYIKGYRVEYYPDVEEFGRNMMTADAYASNWSGRLFLWAFAWAYIILCVAIPIMTWKLCSAAFRKIPNKVKSSQQNNPS